MPSQSSVGPYASNQVTWSSLNSGAGLTYDAAGDVTYDGLNSYIYDAEGRICAVKNSVGSLTGYIYDAAGIRVVKGSLTSFSCNFAASGGNGFAVNTSWALGQDGEQVTEFSVNSGVSTWKHSNIYAGKLLGTYDTKGLHFYLDDWLGTRRIQTNALGQLELTCQSLPYGNGENCIATALSTAEDPTEQHFTGKERDAESGNDYFEARYYSSAAGRFMSPDWSAKEEPVPYAKLDDPQTLNLYDYVRNSPMTGVDANGHCPWCALAGAAIGVGAELLADKLTGKPVTVRGVIGAAVGGAIVGGSMGLATGEGLAIGAAIAGTASVAGGIADRTISTGSLDKALESPGQIVADAAIGMTAHLGGEAIGKLAGRASEAGQAVSSLEKKLESTLSPKRYNKLAQRLPGKEAAAEAVGKPAETSSDLAIHGTLETASKAHEKRNDH